MVPNWGSFVPQGHLVKPGHSLIVMAGVYGELLASGRQRHGMQLHNLQSTGQADHQELPKVSTVLMLRNADQA